MGAALYYPDNEGNFIVIVLSGNQYGMDIQHRIGWLLLGLILVSSVLIYFVGRLYATRMVDRIDAAYQSEKAFISNASHELNNPLTAIQGLTISARWIGIPPEELKRIFQPFYRASNTREYAGHGVGLSLSLRILSTYGAKVNIISDLGVGTSVEIDFG